MSDFKVGDAVMTPEDAVGVVSEVGPDGIGVTYSVLRERDQWPVQGFARYASDELMRLVPDTGLAERVRDEILRAIQRFELLHLGGIEEANGIRPEVGANDLQRVLELLDAVPEVERAHQPETRDAKSEMARMRTVVNHVLDRLDPHSSAQVTRESTLEQELADLLNRRSDESRSYTHDFVLAAFLCDCLDAFHKATRYRDRLRAQGERGNE